ncbi:MAG: hypothetical protein U0521_16250 [Anaerolineae bacterium]
MTYSAEISRANPSMFLFLLDQSGSMSDPFGGGGGKGSVADAINNLLFNLTTGANPRVCATTITSA